MRKLLLGLIVIIALLAVGIKLYVWHKTTSLADKVIVLAGPVASISYDGATSTLWSGQAGLTDITIRPAGMDTTVKIDEFTVEAGDLPGLLTISGALGEGNVPDTLRLNLRHVEVDLDSPIFQNTPRTPSVWGLFGETFGSLACGNRNGFSAADLRRMGISTAEFDLHIGYTLDRAANSIAMQLNGQNYNLNSMELSMSAQMPVGAKVGQMLGTKPQITNAHLHVTDQGWHARWREFCTTESGQSEEAFLTAHTAAVRTAFARRGIGVSDGMLQHYRALLADDSELDITLRPAQPLNFDSLRFYAPADLLYYLNPVVTVNGTPVPIEVQNLDAATVAKAQSRARAAETAKQTDGYQSVPLNTLDRHMGKQVRLTLKNGRAFEGKLVRMDERLARLQRPNFSGNTYEEIVLLWEVQEAAVAAQ